MIGRKFRKVKQVLPHDYGAGTSHMFEPLLPFNVIGSLESMRPVDIVKIFKTLK
jgi:hypothetical protein